MIPKNQMLLAGLLWVATGLCLVVWAVRIGPLALSAEPSLIGTSGCEEEAWFSIWKAVQGLPVYGDPWVPPFAGSYFGWLFYKTYSFLGGLALEWLHLEDGWLPSVCRWITAGFFLLSAGLYLRIFRGFATPKQARIGLPMVFTVLALCNPLFHWWSFTVRADMGALTAELLGLGIALRYAKGGRGRDLWGVAVATYVAWSFRPTSISVLTGMGLWMLTERKWRELFLMVSGMAGAFGASLLWLGDGFLQSVFVANALSGELLGSVFTANASLAFKQDPMFLVGVLCLPVLIARGWARLGDRPTRLLALTAGLSLGWAMLFSAKVGAAANYYFVPACLVPLAAWLMLGGREFSPRARGFLALAAVGMVGVNLMILNGRAGTLRAQSDVRMQELKKLRSSLEAPIFCTDRVANLPWVLGDGGQSMMFGYAYHGMLAKRPEKFREGTLRSMLMERKFATVIFSDINSSYQPTPEELEGYEEVKAGSGYRVFKRMGDGL